MMLQCYVKTMVCSVAINFLEIILILQPARSDAKIGPGRVHGNGLIEKNIITHIVKVCFT